MRDTKIFNQLNNFLENFKAPKTIKIYDYENDRAKPINKFLFTEETITIKDQEKEKKVKILEEEVHSIGRKLDEQNRELFNTVKHELTDHLIIHAKKNEELKENQVINLNDINLREGFSDTIFKEINYNEEAKKALDYLNSVTRRNGAIYFSQGDTKAIGVYSQNFDILPFTQGFVLKTLD